MNGHINAYEQSKLTLMILNMAFMTNKQMKVLDIVRNVIGKDFRYLEEKEKVMKGLGTVFAKEIKRKSKQIELDALKNL